MTVVLHSSRSWLRCHVDGNAAMCRMEKLEDGSFEVFYKNTDGESSVRAGIVMFGPGRSPNTKDVGVEVSCQVILLGLLKFNSGSTTVQTCRLPFPFLEQGMPAHACLLLSGGERSRDLLSLGLP